MEIDFSSSDHLELQPDDELEPVTDILRGDVVCLERVAPRRFALRPLTLDLEEAAEHAGTKYRVDEGWEPGTFRLVRVRPPAGSPSAEESAEEAHDAERVDQAIHYQESGDYPLAYRLLGAVVARTPENYVYQYEEGDTLFVKFWDEWEFMHFVFWQQSQGQDRSVTWVKSAYPRAYYHLGYMEVEAGRYEAAVRYLEAGRLLEPTNPFFVIEQAQALVKAGRFLEAERLYERVQTLGPHVRGEHVARALRGKGYVLIELGALGSAERCFGRSQEYEPESEVAANELEYIRRLLAEKRAVASEPPRVLPEREQEDELGQSGAGASNFSSIGFLVRTGEEFLGLAGQAANNGLPVAAQRGTYIRWSTDVGAELWVQTTRDGNIVGLNPHFSGDARMRVRLEGRVEYPEATVLDGAFYGWANPGGAEPESSDYPFVFDAPDYDLHRGLALPAVAEVQLSAFAHDLEAFADDEAYRASRAGEVWSAESFVPSGLFEPGGEAIVPRGPTRSSRAACSPRRC